MRQPLLKMSQVKVSVITLITLLTQSCGHPVLADSIFTIDQGTDERNAAHFGMSYAINSFAYALNRKALRLKPVDAFIFSAATTLCVGLTYKMMQPGPGRWGDINHAMVWNNAGIIGSGITINMGGW